METIVVTHNGLFHFDEVMSVALIKRYYNDSVHIIRTRNVELIHPLQAVKDAFVVDVGYMFDQDYKNFDHHQHPSLSASNVLVLEYLHDNNLIETRHYISLSNHMGSISDWDTNKGEVHEAYTAELENISMYVKMLNRDPGNHTIQMRQFEKAVEFAMSHLDNIEYKTNQFLKQVDIYNARVDKGEYSIYDGFVDLNKFANNGPIAIMNTGDAWMVKSLDTNVIKLPQSSKAIFVHKEGFMAKFKLFDDAEEYVESFIK
jgi:uncharacterized UPF0160 family protein